MRLLTGFPWGFVRSPDCMTRLGLPSINHPLGEVTSDLKRSLSNSAHSSAHSSKRHAERDQVVEQSIETQPRGNTRAVRRNRIQVCSLTDRPIKIGVGRLRSLIPMTAL